MENAEWTYNKGEWSEAYTLTKLLGDGKVHAADENLNKIEEEFYPILKILKEEIEKQFIINNDMNIIEISDLKGNLFKTIDIKEFIKISNITLKKIKEGKGNTFSIPLLENFIKGMEIKQFKSSSRRKSDMIMEIKDLKTNISKEFSFSIKSELGNKPTILNASKATNFIFKIEGIHDYEVEEIMQINKETDKKWLKLRIGKILEFVKRKKYKLTFFQTENQQFSTNLKLIDSNLPLIVSEILLFFYSNEKITDITSLTEYIVESNPLNLSNNEKELFYKTNMIELIKSSTFGMMPTKKWEKEYDVNGGILTVRNDGEIVCHHIFYNKKQLDEYLFNNTKLETASTKRYQTGEIYKINENENEFYFKLNLQIRMN